MAGYKTWATLDVVNAADLNNYLMAQTVPRYASTAARTAGPSPVTGMVSYVTGVGLQWYNGTAWTNLLPTTGAAVLVGGTVTVSSTLVASTSRILLTVQALGTVTTAKAVAVTARVVGTSFTITSADATDTSTVAWSIEP